MKKIGPLLAGAAALLTAVAVAEVVRTSESASSAGYMSVVPALGSAPQNAALLQPAVASTLASVGGDPGNPEASISGTAQLSVDGVSVAVRTEILNYSPSTRAYNVAQFTVSGPATVSITSLQPVTTYEVTPAALNVPASVSGNTITLSLSGPQNLVIKIAGQPDLLLIATPPEPEVYTASGPGVVYFGPGVTIAGVINCTSDTTYYLAPGALVKGVFDIQNVHNVRIIGRGLIDGANDSKSIATQPVIYTNNASNVKIEGVGVRHSNGWQSLYYNSDHIDISYVNMLGGVVVNRDGIDLDGVEDATIRNSLIYAGDDGFGWHALGSGGNVIGTVPNFPMARILADNNVIYNDVGGNVLRLGSSFETD